MTAGRQSVSATRDWCTPDKIVMAAKEALGGDIALDPCSNRHSTVGARVEYMLPDTDGLEASWDFPTIYANPPYGRDRGRGTSIKGWFAKIRGAASKGSEVVALVPVATNTSRWKEHVFGVARSVCLLYDTRLRFALNGVVDKRGAPMARCVVYYGSHFERFKGAFERHGLVVSLR